MRKYVLVDSISGNVNSILEYGADTDFPSNWVFKKNEIVITVDDSVDVLPEENYDSKTNTFYVLDITDTEIEIQNISEQLQKVSEKLSDFQEETWSALMIDETKLSRVWRERLANKRVLRSKLAELIQI